MCNPVKMGAGLLVVLALTCQAKADTVFINFNDLPVNTILTNQYSSLGVTFSAFENSNPVNSAIVNIGATSNYWGNTTSNSCICLPPPAR